MRNAFLYAVTLTHTECGYNRPGMLGKSLELCREKNPSELNKTV